MPTFSETITIGLNRDHKNAALMSSDQIYPAGNTGMQGVGVGEFHGVTASGGADDVIPPSSRGLNFAMPSMFSPFPPLVQGGGAEMLNYSSWPTLYRTPSNGASTSQNSFINPNFTARPPLLHNDSMDSSIIDNSSSFTSSMNQPIQQQQQYQTRPMLSSTESSSSVETAANDVSINTITPLTAKRLGEIPDAIPGLYSATGFNMLPILARLNDRLKKSTLQIGPVDCSCAFTITNSQRFDNPIVYASAKFVELTGYPLNEILGRNCRFLQSPHGHVAKGHARKYTDNTVVSYFSKMMALGLDAQANLINYRKGGQPFINLLTVIPVPEEDGANTIYHVGLQIDLVEQPNTILANMREGVYTFAEQTNPAAAISSQMVAQHSPGEDTEEADGLVVDLMSEHSPDTSKTSVTSADSHTEFLRLLFEEMDDFVHVLSLKGNLLYVSPSVSKVLEYESHELVGKPLAEIAHPSDVVSVMRELKECSSNPSGKVNLLLRFRRKNSGYIWIESVGKLHLEQGKARKCVICTGRPRNIVNLSWERIGSSGGLSQHEIWATISLSGLFLTVAPGTNDMFKCSGLLAGQNILELVNDKSERNQFLSILTNYRAPDAVSSKRKDAVTFQHHILGLAVESTVFYSRSSVADKNSAVAVIHITKIGSQIISPWGITKEGNIFAEIDTTKSTSWQFELHQIRSQNKKMKDEVKFLENLIERS